MALQHAARAAQTREIEMANVKPSVPGATSFMVTTPSTLPERSTTGPPLLPGLVGAET